jgi:hypothetical protein
MVVQHNHVAGEARVAMEDHCRPADQHVAHVVLGEQAQEVLRVLREQIGLPLARSASRTSGTSVP